MTPLLLGEALFQGLEQLVPAERLQFGLLRLGQILLGELAQPFLGDGGGLDPLAQRLQPLEDRGEDPIEPVEMGLVLHQDGAGEEVELLHALVGEVALHRLEQGEVFAQGHRHAGLAQAREELQQHRA